MQSKSPPLRRAASPKLLIPTPRDVAQMQRQLAESLDPVLFANRAGFTALDPFQTEVLRSRSKRKILLAARQSGKSQTAAIATLHAAIYQPGSTHILVSASEKQAQELLKKVRDLLTSLASGAPDVITEGQSKIELRNGSRIISTPASEATLRGYSPQTITIDEAAKVERSTYEQACRPMLAATNGSLMVISTPAGFNNWFAEAWHSDPDAGWERWKVTADDCPRISKEFLAQERASMSLLAYNAEYNVEFTSDAEAAFDHELIHAAFHKQTQATDYPAINFDWEELYA